MDEIFTVCNPISYILIIVIVAKGFTNLNSLYKKRDSEGLPFFVLSPGISTGIVATIIGSVIVLISFFLSWTQYGFSGFNLAMNFTPFLFSLPIVSVFTICYGLCRDGKKVWNWSWLMVLILCLFEGYLLIRNIEYYSINYSLFLNSGVGYWALLIGVVISMVGGKSLRDEDVLYQRYSDDNRASWRGEPQGDYRSVDDRNPPPPPLYNPQSDYQNHPQTPPRRSFDGDHIQNDICPYCGSTMDKSGGVYRCPECGYIK